MSLWPANLSANDLFFAALSQVYTQTNLFVQASPPIRNDCHWASAFDFTFRSFNAPCSLVQPDVVVGANHYPPNKGDTIQFVDNNNNLLSRTVTGQANPSPAVEDVIFCQLDSVLPASITPIPLVTQVPSWDARVVDKFSIFVDQFNHVYVIKLSDVSQYFAHTDNSTSPVSHYNIWTQISNPGTPPSGSPWCYIESDGLHIMGSTETFQQAPMYAGITIPTVFT